jgi:hypothetical protein
MTRYQSLLYREKDGFNRKGPYLSGPLVGGDSRLDSCAAHIREMIGNHCQCLVCYFDIILVSKAFVVDQIDDRTDKTQPHGQNIQDAQSNLSQDKAV